MKNEVIDALENCIRFFMKFIFLAYSLYRIDDDDLNIKIYKCHQYKCLDICQNVLLR